VRSRWAPCPPKAGGLCVHRLGRLLGPRLWPGMLGMAGGGNASPASSGSVAGHGAEQAQPHLPVAAVRGRCAVLVVGHQACRLRLVAAGAARSPQRLLCAGSSTNHVLNSGTQVCWQQICLCRGWKAAFRGHTKSA
jgi:hypothetical protein